MIPGGAGWLQRRSARGFVGRFVRRFRLRGGMLGAGFVRPGLRQQGVFRGFPGGRPSAGSGTCFVADTTDHKIIFGGFRVTFYL